MTIIILFFLPDMSGQKALTKLSILLEIALDWEALKHSVDPYLKAPTGTQTHASLFAIPHVSFSGIMLL